MQFARWRWLVLLAAAPLAAVAQPQVEQGPVNAAADWLIKMSSAARTANYEGSVFYSGDDVAESFRVTHRYQDGHESERVQSLSGEPREVQKQGDKTICLLPAGRGVRRVELPTPKGLFPGLTRERLQQISRIYRFEDLGQDRVAGRVCRGVAIVPHDDFRYGYHVWADAETGVPLKMELRDSSGRILERMEFVEVDFPREIPDSAFIEPPAPPAPPPPPVPAAAAPFSGKLPDGFQVIRREQRTIPGKGAVEHWVLTDGLSAISVFTTQRVTQSRGFQGASRIGALNAYGRISGSVHITVVGEVPPQTVKMIGDGLEPPAAPSPPEAPPVGD
jgi:sigma-E factor negative regulatory protein RseB